MRFGQSTLLECPFESREGSAITSAIRASVLFLLVVVPLQGCREHPSADGDRPILASAIDALGRTVSLTEYPSRIVSTAPSNTEILLALGLRDRLVGVSNFYGDPRKVQGIARIGGYTNPSVETIVSLRPDIAFAARGNPRDVIQQLRRHGMKVFTLDTRTVSGLLSDIEKVGLLTGTAERAQRCVAEIREGIRHVQQKVATLSNQEKPRVLWIVQEQPLRTAGPGSLVDELIALAGGNNVAGNETTLWPFYSMEKLVLQDPQVIILGEDRYKDSPGRVSETLARFKRHPIWNNITAVKNERVHYIPTDLLGQPSPALVVGLEELAACLHPDLFTRQPSKTNQAETEERM
jgi:iron complex transport system substrate-binding protein